MSINIDFQEIHRIALTRVDDVLARFVPGGTRQGAEYIAKNPTRTDANPGSFKVNCNTGVWADFATGDKGRDVVSLVAYATGTRQIEAGRALTTYLFIEPTPAPASTENAGKSNSLSRVVADFKFHHADGQEAYRKQRLEPGWNGEKKSFCFYRMINGKREKGGGGWHLLYRLPEVIKAELVVICEGEKKADTVTAWGLCGTSLDTGSKSKLSPDMVKHLYGKAVIVLLDNDETGAAYGEYLAQTLNGKAKEIKVILLPGLGPKEDVIDWAKSPSNDGAKLRKIMDAAPPWRPTEPDPAAEGTAPKSDKPAKKTGGKRAEAAELLLSLAMDLPLYIDNVGDVYTSNENRMIRVENAEHLLTWQFYQLTGAYPSAESIKGVLRLLVAKGKVEGERITMFTRVGTHEGAIVVDLLQGRCARITRGAVTITAPPPIFRSFPHQQAHPDPDLNGDPWRFLEFCNVAKEQRLVVVVALIASFVPEITNPLLMVHGPPGAAKSTFCLFFKQVCDPSSVELQGLDDVDMKDFYAMLREQWVYIADNVSRISNKMSDILCQVVTGRTVSQRLYYTNTDTVQLKIKNLVLLNGIPSLLHRSDLNDRALAIRLERIRNEQRLGETEIQAKFSAAIPEILGGCLLTLSNAIAIEKELVDFASPVRLHDFARWGYCIAEALGGHGERFLEDLKRDHRQQADDLTENNLLITTLIDCLETHGPKWETQAGTAYSILMERTGLDKKDLLRDATFPHKVQDLKRHLDRLRPILEEWGISYKYGLRSRYGIPVTFTHTATEDPPAPPAVPDSWEASDFEEVTP